MQTRDKQLDQSLHQRANYLTLTKDQRTAYNKITKLLDEDTSRIIILEAPAGCGS